MIEAFIGHMVGDYLFQTDWMGNLKKYQLPPLITHLLVYTFFIWLLTGWPIWALVITFIAHGALDGTMFVKWWCKITHRTQFIDQKCIFFPWSWVIIDNTFHLVQLYLTWKLVEMFI